MKKSEGYSWRVTPEVKAALEQEARREGQSVGGLLEQIALAWLTARRQTDGGHFRTEFQTPDGEAQRDDEHFAHVAAWEYQGAGKPPIRHQEPLVYDEVHMTQRSYK